MRLEERVTSGGAAYVEKVAYDPSGRALRLELVADPEGGPVVRVLTFYGVEEFRREWDEEEDPALLECLIGLHETRTGAATEYLIRLMQSEITFRSRIEPEIRDLRDGPLAKAAVPREKAR